MPDIHRDSSFAKKVLTPEKAEAEALIMRRGLAGVDKELARDWVLVAQGCKQQRAIYRHRVGGGGESGKEAQAGRPFMSFPATLDQRLTARFGPKWHRDPKIKKRVWNMYPEFRLRDKW